ncbi:hypothetical protein [Ensifer sp. LCM 4579]|uniref:hypothetical protein n=1 Tax=Ensifer sp. LCM 4579 TaxID=1848292 RepID=UPI001FCD5EEC|nr:hypothetical protein [Ensifer sp. LCM 4579]
MRRVDGSNDIFSTSLQIVAQNRGIPDGLTLTQPAADGGSDFEPRLIGMFSRWASMHFDVVRESISQMTFARKVPERSSRGQRDVHAEKQQPKPRFIEEFTAA